MSTLIEQPLAALRVKSSVQVILDGCGQAAFAVIPYPEYQALLERAGVAALHEQGMVPHEVVNLMFDGSGMSAARAWREHLGLTQVEVADRMGISQAALAQMEAAKRPRKASRAKLAEAMALTPEQLGI